MGTINKNINFIWYGDNCDSCEPYSFYTGLELTSEFDKVISVVDIKSGGYVYSGWSRDVHLKNKIEFNKLPDLVKNTIGSNYIKNGQSFDKFECGRAYIVEIDEGAEININGLFSANINENTTHRLVNPCPTCEGEQNCNCKKISFTFKNFDVSDENYEGWDDPQIACFDNQNGIVYDMVIDTSTPDVGTKLYLEEKIASEQFNDGSYITDNFTINNQYIFSDSKIYLINGRTIVEVIDCDDIKRTPTPTLVLDPPIDNFCIRYSSVEKNNGTYRLQSTEYNNRPVWKTDSDMFAYYQTPVGVSDMRWMISNQLGGKYGRFADTSGESGPYDVTWKTNTKYYHTLVRGTCEETDEFWVRLGCVDGERPDMKAGDSVAINNDGTIIAVGAKLNSDKGQFAGHVRVYRYESLEWSQMGDDIDGGGVGNFSGHALSLNEDGSILAIGAYNASRSPFQEESTDKNIGEVRIFKWNVTTNAWDSHGNVLYGNTQGARFGISCQLNPVGNLLVVGSSASRDNDTQVTTGSVEIYNFENGNWNQIGQTIYGENNSGFGTATCISTLSVNDQITIAAAGDKMCDVYRYDGKTKQFVRKGNRIQVPSNTTVAGTYDATNSPSSISIAKHGDRIAVGIPNIIVGSVIENSTSGYIQVYQYDGISNWSKLGTTLPGDVTSLKLSDEGTTLAYSDVNYTIDAFTDTIDVLRPGAVFVYQLENNNWTQFGTTLLGKIHNDQFGAALDFTLFNNKVIIVVSSPMHTQYSNTKPNLLGQTCVFESPPELNEEIPTPVDCVYTQTAWSVCSQPCDPDGSGPGVQTRTTTIISEPINGGLECPGTTIIQTCGEERCPIDCEVSGWNWSGTCSKECGGGVETATRTVLQPAQFGGVACPSDLSTSRSCNTHVCPKDCVGSWNAVTDCSEPCGGGTKMMAYQVTEPALGTGLCPDLGKTRQDDCNTQNCPMDCVGDWSDWSSCTASCGGGKQTRSFVVSENERDGGICPNKNKIETRDCNTQGCPQDCSGYFDSWSSCSTSCGGGVQTRSYVVQSDEINGGTCENRGKILTQACNEEPCPQNCIGHWTDYGTCNKECGSGTQTRTFVVDSDELYGGICPNRGGVQSRACNTQQCPQDCEGYWNSWSACTKTCGGGTQTRNFVVRRPERYGGVCPDKGKVESQSCNNNPCPTNCSGRWSAWSSCSKTCGGGTQTREYIVDVSETNGGTCVNRNKTETQQCNTQCCKQDCEGYWTEWGYNNVAGQCSKCETGQQTRKWITTTPQSCGGTCEQYNGKTEYRNPGESVCGCCPTNCVTGWNEGPCTSEGSMSTTDNIQYTVSKFEIITPASCGGKCSQNALNYVGNTRYEIGNDCIGDPVASYKITGFGGTVGDEIQDLIFYPVLWAGNGRGSNVPDLNPNNSSNKVIEGPSKGWYAYQCQSYADTSGGVTPCRGNRKLSFRTPVWSEGMASYYYVLQWGYSAGKVGAYNQIWNGGPTGYRDWQIRNIDGSYRTIASQYGWVLFKMYKRAATYYRTPLGSGVIPGTDWGILTMYGWSYQPDLNDIPGLNSQMPVNGEQLVARNYKWGLNRNPDYLNRYDERYTELGLKNQFGTIKKVKNLGWGSGLVATRPNSSYNMTYTLTE